MSGEKWKRGNDLGIIRFKSEVMFAPICIAEIKDAIFNPSLQKYSKELTALELSGLNACSHLCNTLPIWPLEHHSATMLPIVIGCHLDPYMVT